MPLIRTPSLAAALHAPRRVRNVGPSCRGGASSLLRVGQPAVTFVPIARALARRLTTPITAVAEAA